MKKTSIVELHKQFIDKKLSPVEFAKETIEKMKNDKLNAIVAFDEEAILEGAKKSEERYKEGKPLSLVDGIPVGFKDIINTKGLRTTFGCDAYLDNIPEEDAYVVDTLKKLGALTQIKVNTCQFALGPTGETSLNGSVKNPNNPEYYSGGSSSGGGAAVGDGIIPIAIGTDSGGSIRIPSSLSGIVGMKPTYSLLSTAGILPLSEVVDTPGIQSNTVADSAVMLNALVSYNNKDWRQSYPPSIDYSSQIGESIRGSKIGVLIDLFHGTIDPYVSKFCLEAVDLLRNLGVEIVERKLPDLSELREAHQISMLAFARSVHVKNIKENSKFIYPQVRARLDSGDIPSEVYVRMERKKHKMVDVMSEALKDVEVLIYPTAPVVAQKIGKGEDIMQIGDTETSPFAITGSTSWMASYTGMPCITIPVGKTPEGMPIGLSILGRFFDEANIYRVADHLMKAIDS